MILDEPLITSALAISWIVFASVSAGVLLGLLLRAVLPEASSRHGIEERREAGDGAHRDDVGARPEPADRLGEELL